MCARVGSDHSAPGVVDQDVEPARPVQRRLADGGGTVTGREIGGDRVHFDAVAGEPVGGPGEAVAVDVGQHQPDVVLPEALGRGQADALCRSGDEGHPVRESHEYSSQDERDPAVRPQLLEGQDGTARDRIQNPAGPPSSSRSS